MSFATRGFALAVMATMLVVPFSSVRADESTELRERIGILLKRTSELRRDGKPDEAKELQQEVSEMMREYAEQNRERTERAPDGRESRRRVPTTVQREMMERIMQLSRESMELRRNGKIDEANELQEEKTRLALEISQRHRSETHQPEQAEEQKIHHLHQAAENLEAAGFHNEARDFHRLAEEKEREFQRHREAEHEHGHHEHHGEEMEHAHHEVIHKLEEMQEAIHQLKGEVERLRGEVAQLRKPVPVQRNYIPAQPRPQVQPGIRLRLAPQLKPPQTPKIRQPQPKVLKQQKPASKPALDVKPKQLNKSVPVKPVLKLEKKAPKLKVEEVKEETKE